MAGMEWPEEHRAVNQESLATLGTATVEKRSQHGCLHEQSRPGILASDPSELFKIEPVRIELPP